MQRRATAVALVLLSAVATAASAAEAPAQYDNILEALKAQGLTTFVEASDKTGFSSQLKSPGFIGTVFAPTDDAFQAALDAAGITKQQLFKNNTLLVDVVQHHVVPGDAISSDRLKNDGRYTSMRGKAMTVSKSLGGDVAVNSGSTAQVLDRDMKAGAAMVNVIDNVLLPADELASLNLRQADAVKFFDNIEEVAGNDESLTRLFQASTDAGLDAYLADPTTVATVFAPVDDAWYSVDTMSSYYAGNESAVTGDKKALTNLLKYHILDGKALRASQLKDKQELKMSNGETIVVHVTDKKARKVGSAAEQLAQGVVAARISGVDPRMHILLRPDSDGDEGQVTSADIVAGRSYVHKIDAVLVPKSMLSFLEGFTADAGKNKTKTNATVAEALAANATGTAKAGAAAAKAGAANATAAANATGAASGAAHLALGAALGLPCLLAALLLA